MKKPDTCTTIEEVRGQIDSLDEQIIGLIGKRGEYVVAASKFKTDEAGVRAPERVRALIMSRKEMAAKAGLDPDVIGDVYRILVEYFIREELHHWKREDK